MKPILNRYFNPYNAIKNYSIQIAIDIYEDIAVKSVLIATNCLIDPQQLKTFHNVSITSQSCDVIVKQKSLSEHIHISSINDNTFDFIAMDLMTVEQQEIPPMLNFYWQYLNEGGVFICTILGGKTLYELADAMMQADLLDDRMILRMIPRISADGLLYLTKGTSISPVIMTNDFKIQYSTINQLVHSMREISHIYTFNNHATKKYWTNVDIFYQNMCHNKLEASFEFLTLLAYKPKQ